MQEQQQTKLIPTLQEYANLQTAITDLAKNINFLSSTRPINDKRTDEDKPIDPNKFEYKDLKIDPKDLSKQLGNLIIPETDSFLYDTYTKLISDHQSRCLVLANRGNREIALQHTSQIYGAPTGEYLDKAYEIFKNIPIEEPVEQKKITAQQAAIAFISYLEESYGETDWKIQPVSDTGRMSVLASKKIFKIPTDQASEEFGIPLFKARLKGLIAHEIDTHVVCNLNGQLFSLDVLKTGTPAYLKTQEGLAFTAEEQSGYITHGTIRAASMYYIAAYRAMQSKGPTDIYSELRELGVPPKNANNALASIFRGGGMIKDHVYLEGWQQMKTIIQNTSDVTPYFAAKVRLDQMEGLREFSERYNLSAFDNLITPRVFADPEGFHAFFNKI